MTALLVLTLSHVAVALLVYHFGRIAGAEGEIERYEAVYSRLQVEAAQRERNYRQLLADVQALEAMHSTGRTAGRA